jgi:hypothetical protein
LDRYIPVLVEANKLFDYYAKYRNGPVDMQKEDEFIDGRMRNYSDRYDMTYLQP